MVETDDVLIYSPNIQFKIKSQSAKSALSAI